MWLIAVSSFLPFRIDFLLVLLLAVRLTPEYDPAKRKKNDGANQQAEGNPLDRTKFAAFDHHLAKQPSNAGSRQRNAR